MKLTNIFRMLNLIWDYSCVYRYFLDIYIYTVPPMGAKCFPFENQYFNQGRMKFSFSHISIYFSTAGGNIFLLPSNKIEVFTVEEALFYMCIRGNRTYWGWFWELIVKKYIQQVYWDSFYTFDNQSPTEKNHVLEIMTQCMMYL